MKLVLVVAVAVRHGEHVPVEDAEVGVEGQDGVFALVVFAAAAVGVGEDSCDESVTERKDYHQRFTWKHVI